MPKAADMFAAYRQLWDFQMDLWNNDYLPSAGDEIMRAENAATKLAELITDDVERILVGVPNFRRPLWGPQELEDHTVTHAVQT